MEERRGFVAIELAQHHGSLAFKLVLLEQGIAYGVAHEHQPVVKIVLMQGEKVVHPFFGGGAVPHHAHFPLSFEIRLLIGNRAVGLEEHVLVEVRQSLELRWLGIGAVLAGDFDGGQRHRVILHHDDLQPVIECLGRDSILLGSTGLVATPRIRMATTSGDFMKLLSIRGARQDRIPSYANQPYLHAGPSVWLHGAVPGHQAPLESPCGQSDPAFIACS